jgi:hypothetical protein
MAATSKSPKSILLTAYVTGQLALPDYAHKYSPKTYTQPQLFACLVLKEFLHRDYRGIVALLKDTPDLAAVIELKKIPHFTSLQKACKRLLRAVPASRLLDKTVRLGKFLGKLDTKAPLAALDGTGLESRHASAYYVRRKAKGGEIRAETDLPAVPQGGNSLRLQKPPDPCRCAGTRAGAGHHALPPGLRSGPQAAPFRRAGGRRRLRCRAHARVWPLAPRAHSHSSAHRTTDGKTSQGLLATHHATRPVSLAL